MQKDLERGDTLRVEVAMRKFLSLAVMCSLALPAMAFAQDEEVVEVEEEVMVEETVEESSMTEEEVEDIAEEAAEEAVEEAMESMEEDRPFLDGLTWMAMASAFYRVGGYTNAGVLPGPYNNLLGETARLGYPYTNYNGFGLNFVGGMVQYTGEKFGVTVDLRWGNGAPQLSPLHPVKQGYVSWMPSDSLTFDFGFFDTIFGAEVADEWNNANYTRGALYFLRQPFNHLDIRMGAELSDKVGFTLMVTNGGVFGGGGSLLVADPDIQGIDNNATPTIGWQFSFVPSDSVGLYIGGNHGAGADFDNRNWDNFFDWVLSVGGGPVTLLLNGDYTTSPSRGAGDGGLLFFYGHSLALIFDVTDKFSIGLRGEHLSGNEQERNTNSAFGYLATGTITLRYKPVEYLVLSLEGRGEWTSRDIYFDRNAETDTTTGAFIPNRSHNYAAILGFTAYIGN